MKKFFLLSAFLLFTILPFASAATNSTVVFAEAGTTPDSPLYTFELLYEKVQLNLFTPSTQGKLNLEAEHTAERLAETNLMIERGNYDAAQKSASEINNLLQNTEAHINQLNSEGVDYNQFLQGGTTLNNLLEIQQTFLENSKNADAIKETLLTHVEKGDVNKETAALIINDAQEGISGMETSIIDKKNEIVEKTAETNSLPELQVKTEVEIKEEKLGTSEIMRNDVTEQEILTLETAIAKIEQQIPNATKEGKQNEADAAKVLLENAKLKLQISENALENGDIGKAFGQFTAAEHLALNADKISQKNFSALGKKEVAQIKDNLGQDAQEINDEIEKDTLKNINDWEKHKDELTSRYPDKKDYFEKKYEQSKRVKELAGKLSKEYSQDYEKLKSEGKSDEEIKGELTARFSDEFRKSYGEDFIPPGFVDTQKKEGTGIEAELEVIPIGRIDKEFFNRYDEGGGFLKDHAYTDPVSEYQYTFRNDGYSYTTPSGETYAVKYPENYKPKTYSRGDEVYDYTYTTADGTYEYKYASTGYEVKNPDGTTEAFTYPQGKYEVVGGGKIEQKPTGFEYTPDKGKKITYDYNPEFKNYVASDGKAYIPPEGTSYQSENTHYDGTGKTYTYSHGGENWKYDPNSNKWTSSKGDTYTPSATTGAPVGYEDKKTYTTEKGDTWNYDSAKGSWKSASGKQYTPPPSSYYSYDSKEGHYVDAYGNTHENSEGLKDYSGKTWSYDTSAGTWQASNGEKYNPYTGSTTTASGEKTNQYNSGGYQSSYSGNSYTDSSGKTWSHDSSAGTWTSPSGGSYSTSSGEASYSGSGSYSGGTYSGGTTSSGGTYSGSTSTGSYSGGSAPSGSYSAPSGGTGY